MNIARTFHCTTLRKRLLAALRQRAPPVASRPGNPSHGRRAWRHTAAILLETIVSRSCEEGRCKRYNSSYKLILVPASCLLDKIREYMHVEQVLCNAMWCVCKSLSWWWDSLSGGLYNRVYAFFDNLLVLQYSGQVKAASKLYCHNSWM